MSQFISGMIAMGYLVAGMFFLRFWRDTRDRLFGMYGAAFFILTDYRRANGSIIMPAILKPWSSTRLFIPGLR